MQNYVAAQSSLRTCKIHLQVRASSLQELVYKQGQAGITKATVSIVFNNQDKQNSPVGFDHDDKITVTRQVLSACSAKS